MSVENIVACCILIIAVAAMIALTVYKSRKQNKEITIDQFIEIYYNNIIAVLQDVVSILQINTELFDDKESFDKAIINITITKIVENANELGIDTNLVNLFNTDALTNAIYGLFREEEEEVFSAIGYEAMESKPELYSAGTIAKLKRNDEVYSEEE